MLIRPHWLENVLAKSEDKSVGESAETLSQHTWNVLQRFSDLVRLRPDLPARIGEPRLWHCLFWACFMHDLGKAAEGFQRVLRDRTRRTKWPQRHEALSLAFVQWLFPDHASSEWLWVIVAIASHHKDVDYMDMYPSDLETDDDVLASLLAEIPPSSVSGIWDWLDQCPPSWIEALGLTHAGIECPRLVPKIQAISQFYDDGVKRIHQGLEVYRGTARAMWENPKHPMKQAMILLRGHLISSDHMASAHVGELPEPQLSDPEQIIAKLKLTNLYDHQRKSMHARGSTVLMAPTGSGKTEAALLWAVSQSAPRLYYTLPFQASMNAMERRLNEDEKNERGEITREAPFKNQVGLEHSRSLLTYYRMLMADKFADPNQAIKLARQFKDLARLNYYPVRVLSPYQMLKAPYRLKGYEALLTDCYGGAFVFDEIHAYEAGRLAKILALVRHLREHYDAKFLVMSATMPKLLRDRLTDALGNYTPVTASDDLYKQFRRHALILKNGDLLSAENLSRIAAVAQSGQAVLVCCNTIPRAQLAWKELRNRLEGQVRVELLHGKFNGRDRLKKEETVRKATGSRSTVREKSIILVATQVVEVSLDIDLDVIYADPAPLEALLQRFGRVNRRRLKECAPVCVFREPVPDKPRPYKPELIHAALDVLEAQEGKLLDEAQISTWLDKVYERPEVAEPWSRTFGQEYEGFAKDVLANLRAFQSDDALEEKFYEAFESVDVLPEDLYSEYLDAREQSLIEASQLLVPLHYTMFGRLKSEGRGYKDEEKELRLVSAYYDSEVGLDLNRDSRQLHDDW